MSLVKTAEHAPKETFQEVDIQLENVLENLRQAAEMVLDGQKENAEKTLNEIAGRAKKTNTSLDDVLSLLSDRPEDDLEEINRTLPNEKLDLGGKKDKTNLDWTEEALNTCTTLFATHSLKDGDLGWPYSRIFNASIFIAAQKIRLVEPYLVKSHQLRNLQELLLYIVDNSKPKLIEVFTLPFPIEKQEYNTRHFDNLVKNIFKDYGVTLELLFSHELHDRYLFSDTGYVAKLGRGLDIYKPSPGLAAHRQESRKVRACEITIFSK